MQPEFTKPEFIENNSAEEIHERMMNNLPPDIDDMPGGFPYDFTKPAALEKDEFINYHLVRALMIAFPQYAWDEWLDLHGQQVHIERHQPKRAYGKVQVIGTAGTELVTGVIFCTPATDTGPAIEYKAVEDAVIGEDGTALIPVEAVESGTSERESNDDFYDRIAAEYENSMTYLGNDSDYIRWAKQAGAGDCIVVSVAEGPGTVKLVLVDGNGQPANDKLVQDVYNYIVSPDDRSKRLLPTACSRLICEPATTVKVDFTITGFIYDETTSIEQIKEDFAKAVKAIYAEAKKEGILRYNDVRPIISDISGVEDFDTFLMNGDMKNLKLDSEEYPETGTLDFS